MQNTKVMKGAVVVSLTAGLSLWNMESQEVVALAPVNYHSSLPSNGEQWEQDIDIADDNTDALRMVKLEKIRKVRVKEHRLEVKRALEEKRRQKRMAEIQACCGVHVSDRDRNILERIVEAEAGDQNHTGKLLVANVILNRVKSGKFPSSIRGVVFSPRQFSPISDGRYYRVHVSADTKSAVNDALHGIDGSQGALYFMDRRYSDRSNVTWFDRCLTRLFAHEGHEFFR